MKKQKITENNTVDMEQVTEKLQNVGINLTLIASLINFLEYGVTDEINFSNRDIQNLIVVMRKLLSKSIEEHNEIELMFDM